MSVFVTPVFVTTGRNRWVEYAPAVGTDYDGSMVPAEWYGWLHYKADETPIQVSEVPDLHRGGGGRSTGGGGEAEGLDSRQVL